jgi:ABC-2 type transport system permease protein
MTHGRLARPGDRRDDRDGAAADAPPGENLFATIVIPTIVLLLFSSLAIVRRSRSRGRLPAPGSIALGIVATCLVSLGISTAYDRPYGVLKRLGGSPLSRGELVVARLLSVLASRRSRSRSSSRSPGSSSAGGPVPTCRSPSRRSRAARDRRLRGPRAADGRTLRAETVLALANLLFLGFLVVGGVIVPLDHLPGPLAAIGAALPAAPLSELLQIALGTPSAAGATVVTPLVLLGAWADRCARGRGATFRWE